MLATEGLHCGSLLLCTHVYVKRTDEECTRSERVITVVDFSVPTLQ